VWVHHLLLGFRMVSFGGSGGRGRRLEAAVTAEPEQRILRGTQAAAVGGLFLAGIYFCNQLVCAAGLSEDCASHKLSGWPR
jgi:hypothetical protein